MSVISESLEFDEIVIISNFVSCKKGEEFDWDNAVEFNVGDRVKYIGEYENMNVRQAHLKWFVLFQTENGDLHSASQLYFVTDSEWALIAKYFNTDK